MSTPAVAAAVAKLVQLMSSPSARVDVAVTSGKPKEVPDTRSLALDDGARGFFAAAAAGVAAKLAGADGIEPYDATFKPEENEFEWASLGDAPAVELALSRLERFSELGGFSPDDKAFMRHLKYATTVIREGDEVAYLFRSFSRTHELTRKRGITLALRDGRFAAPAERLFQFDEDADVVILDDVLIVIHKRSFQRLFDLLEAVFTEAKAAATTLSGQLPIKNFAVFQEAVGKDSNLADKVIAVIKRSYFPHLTMQAVEATNMRFHLGVPIVLENGVKCIEFSNLPGERWKLLKLLDDDHLDSTMTQAMYEVNSKRAY